MVSIDNWKNEIEDASSLLALEDIKLILLGKKGLLTVEMKKISSLSMEEKRDQGQKLNVIRNDIQTAYLNKKECFEHALLEEKMNTEALDLTLDARPVSEGKSHLLSQVMNDIERYFSNLGFLMQDGPDIDTEENNFDALNIPASHPARQSHDTFYLPSLDQSNQFLLRTHTSNIQIRTMRDKKPPFRCLSLGRCYRSDAVDATHTPMFHQMEIFAVDTFVTMAHLKTTIIDFLRFFFEKDDLEIRFRPSFFPFTVPSAEVDIMMPGKGWLEILGSGLIHPNVLSNCSIDNDKYQGFAAGLGIERLTMLKYNIKDIRLLYDNDQRFLDAFGH